MAIERNRQIEHRQEALNKQKAIQAFNDLLTGKIRTLSQSPVLKQLLAKIKRPTTKPIKINGEVIRNGKKHSIVALVSCAKANGRLNYRISLAVREKGKSRKTTINIIYIPASQRNVQYEGEDRIFDTDKQRRIQAAERARTLKQKRELLVKGPELKRKWRKYITDEINKIVKRIYDKNIYQKYVRAFGANWKANQRKPFRFRTLLIQLGENIKKNRNPNPTVILQKLNKLINSYIPQSARADVLQGFPMSPEKLQIDIYRKKMDRFIAGIDPGRRTKYMHQRNRDSLLRRFKFLEKGDNGHPLKMTINGEKWYLSDNALDDTAPLKLGIKMYEQMYNEIANKNSKRAIFYKKEIERLKKQIRQGKPHNNLTTLILTKASNPLIQTTLKLSKINKSPRNALQIFQKYAARAQKEWDSQERAKQKVRNFDLPRNRRVAYLSLVPSSQNPKSRGYERDSYVEKGAQYGKNLPNILKAQGYNIEKGNITYTENPEQAIRKKLEAMRRAKPPIKHIVLDITAHGLHKSEGGGSQFKWPKTPKPEGVTKHDVNIIENWYKRKGRDKSLNLKEYFAKYRFKSSFASLTPSQKQKMNDILVKAQKLISILNDAAVDKDKSLRLHGSEMVKICREYPDIKFMIINRSCYGGDMARAFEKAQLPNVTLSLSTQRYHVAMSAVSKNRRGREVQGPEFYSVFFQKALMYMGKNLKIPKIVNGKMIQRGGNAVMTDFHIKTVGDAMYYADIMSTYYGSIDDPEVVLPGGNATRH